MSLETKIMGQLKQAMRDKNDVALRTLRSIKAALLEAKTAVNAKAELSEADELKLLQKMTKQRKDSMVIFKEQGREDLAQKEADEVQILETFLPAQISDTELQDKVKAIIDQTGARTAADMGKVMGAANKALAGQAEGARIAAMVRSLLS